jgi:transcriptional regulator with XRE-family HTH domain
MASRPRYVTVSFRGIAYRLDLVRCRRALVDRQVEDALDSMESLAQKVGASRSTVSRFFSGRQTSLTITLKLLRALDLTFEQAATPIDDRDQPAESGAAGLAALGLSGYVLNGLRASGITTVGQILARTQDELLAIRNLGRGSLDEIKRQLVEKGFVAADQIETAFG